MLNLPCHACGANEGALHETGCDMERCPFCGGQLITCGCQYQRLGYSFHYGKPNCGLPERIYKEGLNEEEWEKWEEILAAKGRVPWICYPPMCAKCGMQWPKFFMVPNEEWAKYIAPREQDKVLCRECYDTIKERIDNGGPVPHCRHEKEGCDGP